jgi:hypothetical protein
VVASEQQHRRDAVRADELAEAVSQTQAEYDAPLSDNIFDNIETHQHQKARAAAASKKDSFDPGTIDEQFARVDAKIASRNIRRPDLKPSSKRKKKLQFGHALPRDVPLDEQYEKAGLDLAKFSLSELQTNYEDISSKEQLDDLILHHLAVKHRTREQQEKLENKLVEETAAELQESEDWKTLAARSLLASQNGNSKHNNVFYASEEGTTQAIPCEDQEPIDCNDIQEAFSQKTDMRDARKLFSENPYQLLIELCYSEDPETISTFAGKEAIRGFENYMASVKRMSENTGMLLEDWNNGMKAVTIETKRAPKMTITKEGRDKGKEKLLHLAYVDSFVFVYVLLEVRRYRVQHSLPSLPAQQRDLSGADMTVPQEYFTRIRAPRYSTEFQFVRLVKHFRPNKRNRVNPAAHLQQQEFTDEERVHYMGHMYIPSVRLFDELPQEDDPAGGEEEPHDNPKRHKPSDLPQEAD